MVRLLNRLMMRNEDVVLPFLLAVFPSGQNTMDPTIAFFPSGASIFGRYMESIFCCAYGVPMVLFWLHMSYTLMVKQGRYSCTSLVVKRITKMFTITPVANRSGYYGILRVVHSVTLMVK